ncbi:MAG: hypothetical protein IJS74_01405 [Clostridia bacterium]|nr:hypothetical protein [Clostridia bacterium]
MEYKLTKDCEIFHKSLSEASKSNAHGCFVDVNLPEHYKDTNNFILLDGVSGFAIDDGNLIAVHKNPIKAKEYGIDHVMQLLMLTAINNGAERLDCYGTFLTETYMQYGFLPVGKMDFDVTINPSWPVEKFGTPDVFALARVPLTIKQITQMQQDNSFVCFAEIIDDIPKFDDYFKMLECRDKMLQKFKQQKLRYGKCVEEIFGDEKTNR